MPLALLAVGKVRADQEQLEAALTGHLDDHHRFLLGEYLQQIEHLDLAIKRLTAEITRRFTPPPPPQEGKEGPNQPPTTERAQVQEEGVKGESAGAEMPETRQEGVVSAPALLTWEQAVILASSIPGISQRAACALLAEIGINMRQFPTAGHLARFRWGLPRQ